MWRLAFSECRLLLVAKTQDHVVKFFKRDEAASVTQFVLVDGRRKFRDAWVFRTVAVLKLASFDTRCLALV